MFLHRSAEHGNIEVAELLIKNGADPTIEDNYDDDALNWAQSKGHGAEFKKLLMENRKLTNLEKTKLTHDSSSSDDDSSVIDESGDTDKAFFDSAVKGMFNWFICMLGWGLNMCRL